MSGSMLVSIVLGVLLIAPERGRLGQRIIGVDRQALHDQLIIAHRVGAARSVQVARERVVREIVEVGDADKVGPGCQEGLPQIASNPTSFSPGAAASLLNASCWPEESKIRRYEPSPPEPLSGGVDVKVHDLAVGDREAVHVHVAIRIDSLALGLGGCGDSAERYRFVERIIEIGQEQPLFQTFKCQAPLEMISGGTLCFGHGKAPQSQFLQSRKKPAQANVAQTVPSPQSMCQNLESPKNSRLRTWVRLQSRLDLLAFSD
jgi:hypothetical protein